MIVETDSLTKRYGSFAALRNCTLQVDQGEVFGLLGPNGAGKTTLIRTLMGFLKPTLGWAKIDGLNCTTDSVAVHERVAYLPGDARLFRRMRGSEVLRFFAGTRMDGDFSKSKKFARRLDLDISRRVSMMSTGMRQKLALAATLSTTATVMILDEPTANLDPNVRTEFNGMLAEAKLDGRTILLSSHVLSEIEESSDRVVILRRGQLVHTQIMSELRIRHRISALAKNVPNVPDSVADHIELVANDRMNGIGERLTFHTVGDLAPSLSWISSLELSDVRAEPLGLRYVYDQFHHASEEPTQEHLCDESSPSEDVTDDSESPS